MSGSDRQSLLGWIRDVPDWPEPGVMFKDITPLLGDRVAFGRAIDLIADDAQQVVRSERPVDVVVGIEARGFIFGAAVAYRLDAGFVPVRKQGKLPSATTSVSFALEYGQATIEIHRDALAPGRRVLVVDDVLATGGTVRATVDLVRSAGAEVAAVGVLMELTALKGRERLNDVDVCAVLTV